MGGYSPARAPSATGSLEEVYDLFPVLQDRPRQRADTMSGGQQQMLAIGRALMARPSCLTLDEPSVGWRPSWRSRCSTRSAGSATPASRS